MAVTIGYHASHEQFAPSELLRLVQRAAGAGFDAALNSDHFHPWTEAQGQSGFAWSWMGAALASTSLGSIGVVNAPGQRYHPAIIAQALATLGEMFEGRVWVALGSGQALNEQITGSWPAKDQRHARLLQCVQVMRDLLRGEEVTVRGLINVESAKLYTRPRVPPLLAGAAITEQTARWVGGWADALLTVSRPPAEQRRVIEAFRQGGGEGKPLFLKVQLSFGKNDAEARQGAHEQWAGNVLPSTVLSELRHPHQFADAARLVSEETLARHVRISSDLQQHAAWLHEDLELGFSRVYLHNVNREQARFIDSFGEHVLPQLRAQ